MTDGGGWRSVESDAGPSDTRTAAVTKRARTGLLGLFGVILLVSNMLIAGLTAVPASHGIDFSAPYVQGAMCLAPCAAAAVVGIGFIWKRNRNWRWVAQGLFWSMLVVFVASLFSGVSNVGQ